jgi:hypothetical protein
MYSVLVKQTSVVKTTLWNWRVSPFSRMLKKTVERADKTASMRYSSLRALKQYKSVWVDIPRAVQNFFISLLFNVIRFRHSLVTFMFQKVRVTFVLYIYSLSKSLQSD